MLISIQLAKAPYGNPISLRRIGSNESRFFLAAFIFFAYRKPILIALDFSMQQSEIHETIQKWLDF